MHGATSVHSQTVGHARTAAAVASTASPTVAGRPRIVTWKTREHVNEPTIIENVLHNVTQKG